MTPCGTSLDDEHLSAQVIHDLIWVWAESGPNARLESALTPPNLVPELEDEKGLKSGVYVPLTLAHRDMAYGWDTLMENIVVSMLAGLALSRL